MVAFPCGSRSTSRTRRCACARAAARLTLVVVLPTPPFWFTTARTRATSGPRRTEHEVALRVEQRHAQRDHPAVVSLWRRPGHGGKHPARRDEVGAARREPRKLRKGARDDKGEPRLRPPVLHSPGVHRRVGETELDSHLAEERDLLLAGVVQRHAPLRACDSERNP